MRTLRGIGEFIVGILLIIMIAVMLASLVGCSDTPVLSHVRDADITRGCVMVDGGAGFDSYFNTTKGNVVLCKLKCSKDLPACYYFNYDNTMTKCKGTVRTPCDLPEITVHE